MPRPIRVIAVTSRYVRSFRKLTPAIQERLIERERLFKADPWHPILRTHKLKGRLRFLCSYSVDDVHRILFAFTG